MIQAAPTLRASSKVTGHAEMEALRAIGQCEDSSVSRKAEHDPAEIPGARRSFRNNSSNAYCFRIGAMCLRWGTINCPSGSPALRLSTLSILRRNHIRWGATRTAALAVLPSSTHSAGALRAGGTTDFPFSFHPFHPARFCWTTIHYTDSRCDGSPVRYPYTRYVE